MIKKLLILLLLCSSVLGQVPYQKPMMGQQIDWSNPLSKGLVGYWLMNEGTGNIVQDLSGNGNDGTFGVGAASPSWIAGNHGSAINFDGGDTCEITEKSNVLAITNALTIIANVKFNNTSAYDSVINRYDAGGGYGIYYSSQPRLRFVVRDGGSNYDECLISGQPVTGEWMQIAGVFDGANSYIYKNAILGDTQVGTALSNTSTDTLSIGTGFYGDSFVDIDHVMIWNRALSAREIQDLHSNPFGMFQPTFSVWWGGIGGEESIVPILVNIQNQ